MVLLSPLIVNRFIITGGISTCIPFFASSIGETRLSLKAFSPSRVSENLFGAYSEEIIVSSLPVVTSLIPKTSIVLYTFLFPALVISTSPIFSSLVRWLYVVASVCLRTLEILETATVENPDKKSVFARM